MSLEQSISAAVMAAKQIERAYHDAGPWSISVGGRVFPAVKSIKGNRVVFVSIITANQDKSYELSLLCGDDVVASRVEFIEAGTSQCSWNFLAPEHALV